MCVRIKFLKVLIFTHLAHVRNMRKFAWFENFPLYGILAEVNVHVIHQPHVTLHRELKDPFSSEKASGVVYSISCRELSEAYIGQTGHLLGTQLAEHRAAVKYAKTDALFFSYYILYIFKIYFLCSFSICHLLILFVQLFTSCYCNCFHCCFNRSYCCIPFLGYPGTSSFLNCLYITWLLLLVFVLCHWRVEYTQSSWNIWQEYSSPAGVCRTLSNDLYTLVLGVERR